MPNKLLNENSPYLLQHAHNPVDWYPWGAEALEKARSAGKPIFLSIGYAACHWCHVMAHESFEDEETAAIMNEYFINIKVDREERPDLDGIYMQAVVAMTGQGGWPMSVFLTPTAEPFYGGTYFPPLRRYNMPAFREVLLTIARLWREDRSRLLESSVQISQYIKQSPAFPERQDSIDQLDLNPAVLNLSQSYDWKFGGWGKAPKFPQPMTIEFLLQRAAYGDEKAARMAFHTLQSMASGGMYDIVGGGFSRYSTDERWCVPHFEKMAYDNAQLARCYLHAWMLSGEERYRRVCVDTLDFVHREMAHPDGGFFSSLDADSEGEEGKFYVWSYEELRQVIKTPQDFDLLVATYGISPSGNFEGKTVLQRSLSDEQLAEKFNLPLSRVDERLRTISAQALFEARSHRIRPGTDDKVLLSWNGLMLIAFAEAARYLDRQDYLSIAQGNARFLLANFYSGDRLLRSWRSGQARHNAYLEDYAALILGLLALYQADWNPEWYIAGKKLAEEMTVHFVDPEGGFFDTRDDHEELITRPKDLQDNATPSGNALAITALLQLAAYEGRSDWRHVAEQMINRLQDVMVRYPTAFAQWLCAADFAIGPSDEIAVLGELEHPDTIALLRSIWDQYHPRQVVASSPFPPPPGSPALLHERPLLNDRSTAYVCQGFVCQKPTNDPDEVFQLLSLDQGSR